MQRTAAWFAVALCAAVLFTAVAGAAQSEHVVFLSTQLRPISEAQKMRNFILKDFPGEVDYLTERAGLDPVRISKEGRAGGRVTNLHSSETVQLPDPVRMCFWWPCRGFLELRLIPQRNRDVTRDRVHRVL